MVQQSPNANAATCNQGTPKDVKKLLEDCYDKACKHHIDEPWLQYLGLLLATIYIIEQVVSFDQLQHVLYEAVVTKIDELQMYIHAYPIFML